MGSPDLWKIHIKMMEFFHLAEIQFEVDSVKMESSPKRKGKRDVVLGWANEMFLRNHGSDTCQHPRNKMSMRGASRGDSWQRSICLCCQQSLN